MPDSPVKILIAEDSPTQAEQLQYILEQKGYEVSAANNGLKAYELAVKARPAMIVSDIIMPEMDGYELCRKIKEDALLHDIPVILVTTMSDPQDVIRGLECGADNFVLKPYSEQYLVDRVRYVLLNREMRKVDEPAMGVEIYFNGQRHFITADRLQILNLLMSTYEAAIQRNKELNRSQEELQLLNAQLDTANKELESFSYSVSHDLRAPLRHIDGYLGLLEKHIDSSLDDKGRAYLKIISEAARNMGMLIDDLLAFSRMGRTEMMQSEMELEPLIHEAIRELQPEIQHRQIKWKVLALPKVKADLSMIRQVFANLLSNAAKYTRTREIAEIEVGVKTSKKEYIFFVRDNGVGFDMRYVDKLFGVFQRLHRAEEFEGTGIGLANVRRIIARHGGRTWAESKLGHGATFFFSLPKSQEQHDEQLQAHIAGRR
ncbi:MAG TPA: response regulator [Methylophilaceae bacterium]|nr:response regulator [Methylophilaceae bacterium]